MKTIFIERLRARHQIAPKPMCKHIYWEPHCVLLFPNKAWKAMEMNNLWSTRTVLYGLALLNIKGRLYAQGMEQSWGTDAYMNVEIEYS